MANNWTTDIKDWNIIGKDTANLILSLTERRLIETVSTADDITRKTDRLLAMAVPVATVVIGYLLKESREKTTDELLFTFSAIALLPLATAFYFLIVNYMPYTVEVPGASPEHIFTSERLGLGLDPNTEFLYIISLQIQAHQDRIDHNRSCNKRRSRNNYIAQWALVSLPAFLFVAYLASL